MEVSCNKVGATCHNSQKVNVQTNLKTLFTTNLCFGGQLALQVVSIRIFGSIYLNNMSLHNNNIDSCAWFDLHTGSVIFFLLLYMHMKAEGRLIKCTNNAKNGLRKEVVLLYKSLYWASFVLAGCVLW